MSAVTIGPLERFGVGIVGTDQPNSTTTCFPNSGEKWALKDFLKGVA